MSKKIIYVPLDERNCNYEYPFELGKCTGMDIVRPPKDIISSIKRPGDVDALWEWLYKNAGDSDYAILSLDMLVYGCLINSRRHHIPGDECLERLGRLKKLKQINSKIEIHAFILIMRVSNYDNSSEEPDYWENFGKSIWKYSWLYDKNSKAGLSPAEADELKNVNESIPQEILKDYHDRRGNNLKVNLTALDMVSEGVIDHLIIPKDDTSEFGFSTNEQDHVNAAIDEKGLNNRVFVYPGTDEAGCTLVSRVFNKIKDRIPRVFVCYSSTLGPQIIAKYEDRPINESIKWQVLSAGGFLTDDCSTADIILMANTPGKYMLESEDQSKRDYSYTNFRNLIDFTRKLIAFADSGRTCIVADIAYCNGADNELMKLLIKERLVERIAGFGGWNTACNTLGVVILQGMIASGLKIGNIKKHSGLYRFLIMKMIEDWAYQANVYVFLARCLSQEWGYDPDRLGEFKEKIIKRMLEELNEFICKNFIKGTSLKRIKINGVELTWNRLFDFRFDFDME